MKRFYALVLVSALLTPLVFAQRVVTGTTQVAFCKVKNADGTYSFSRGAPITFTIEQIDAARLSKTGRDLFHQGGPFAPPNGFTWNPLGAAFNTTVYQNDTGDNIVCAEGPSCLDDLVLTSAGNNKAWKIVNFGVFLTDSNRTGKFLVRWRGYETITGNLGPGVSAFSDEMFDFGFYLDRASFPPGPPTGSAFMVTGNLSLNPLAIVPDQVCYLAQQFRVPHPLGPLFEDGEGPFTNVWNIFTSNGPQIGTSEDLFWYDAPADGIYDETEPDNFGEDAPGAGSFLFKIEVGSGNTTTLNPFSYQWIRGNYQSGNIGSLWFDDSNYNVAKAGLVLFPNEAPAQIVVETFSPTFNPVGMRLDANAKVNTPGLGMRIELFNFSNNQFVQVYQGAAGTTDVTGIGFAATPGQFVQGMTGLMRAKVSFYRTGLTFVFPWTASVDMIKWTITNS